MEWILIFVGGFIWAMYEEGQKNKKSNNKNGKQNDKQKPQEKYDAQKEKYILSKEQNVSDYENEIKNGKDAEMDTTEEEWIERIKKTIIAYMSDRFYIEGEEKDYYFGKSILNDGLTIFYNDTYGVEYNLSGVLFSRLADLLYKNFLNYGFIVVNRIDLKETAFNIPVKTAELLVRPRDDEGPTYFSIQLNLMPPKVLEDAIEKNHERWELYKSKQEKNIL